MKRPVSKGGKRGYVSCSLFSPIPGLVFHFPVCHGWAWGRLSKALLISGSWAAQAPGSSPVSFLLFASWLWHPSFSICSRGADPQICQLCNLSVALQRAHWEGRLLTQGCLIFTPAAEPTQPQDPSCLQVGQINQWLIEQPH